MLIQVRGVVVRAMSGTELFRVRTELGLRRPEPINKSLLESRGPTLLCNQVIFNCPVTPHAGGLIIEWLRWDNVLDLGGGLEFCRAMAAETAGDLRSDGNLPLRVEEMAMNTGAGAGAGAGTHPVHKAMASHTHPGDLPWVPWAPGHFIKLIKLNPVTGQIILFIRSLPGAALQMHFHPGTVVVYTVQGAWTYDEGWVSGQGDVVFEVAGSTHSPRMVGKEDTIVFAVIEGALDFVDEKGQTIATENWQTFLKRYQDYCEEKGLVAAEITRF